MISPLLSPNIFLPELEMPSSPVSVSSVSYRFSVGKEFEDIDVSWIKNLNIEYFVEFDECVSHEELVRYCDPNKLNDFDFEVLLESVRGLFYYISNIYLDCRDDIKHAIICSAFNLYKEYIDRNNVYDMNFDKDSIFDFFHISPVVCFWISQKYITNELEHLIVVDTLEELSGINKKIILMKEIELLLYFDYKIRYLMLC